MLRSLLEQQLYEKVGTDTKTLSLLPNDVMTSLRKNIRKGAEDLEQNWANALELVHKAYEVEGVQRPNPSLKDAWTQYEENIAYAVQQLSLNRGASGDWRMSASMFKEAMEPTRRYRVKINDDEYITEGKDAFEIINKLTEGVGDFETHIKPHDGGYQVSFTRFRVRNKTKVQIDPLT